MAGVAQALGGQISALVGTHTHDATRGALPRRLDQWLEAVAAAHCRQARTSECARARALFSGVIKAVAAPQPGGGYLLGSRIPRLRVEWNGENMVHRVKLAATDLDVFPICLGGNVFGWTSDEQASFEVLDGYAGAGGNFIDTADAYMAGVPGNRGGESETVIGRWLAKRGRRDDVVIATKVGMWDRHPGLGASNIRAAAEDSLRRLSIDYIDLYYAHRDDESTPLTETLGAFDALVRAGKVRYVGVSNYSAPRLRQALQISQREGLAGYVALQTHYNLMERDYESQLAGVAAEHKLAVLPYFALAMGFLTGKYRAGARVDSARAQRASAYLDERGERVLGMLEQVAEAHQVSMAAVSLAWLRAQPTVSVPIASARTTNQLTGLIQAASLELTQDEVSELTQASNRTS